jgi:2-polyprenyl-3-methyl-5-hydroxy-6-metoxy-1,4-benzoquinol methylase
MTNWYEYWNSAQLIFDYDPMRQVGKTVGGRPIDSQQLDAIVGSILQQLGMTRDDTVLDLCCGNGAVTSSVARHCSSIRGIDFSRQLIESAQERFGGPNVAYVCADVCDLDRKLVPEGITKIYLYEGLQHLEHDSVRELLTRIRESFQPFPPVLIGSVPDRDRIWQFYDTPDRVAEYRQRVAVGTEPIGTWWRQQEIRNLASDCGLACAFNEQSGSPHTAHYRFDVLVTPAGGA